MPSFSRRRFISRAAAAAMAVQFRCHAADEQARAYHGPVIDTHTHFYDPTRPQGVPWPPRDDKILYHRVLPADFKALPKPGTVLGTVVVEASPWLEDNQWILALAESEPLIVGFVGNLSPGTREFRSQLKRFASNRLFRGIRIGSDRVRDGLSQTNFLEDMRALAEQDLAVDLLGGPDTLPDVRRLAQAVPHLRLIIDHVGNPQINGGAPDPKWRDGMMAASEQANVYCKMSGLVEGTGHTDGKAPSESSFYRRILDVLWQAFGPDRLIYGSNWPVSARFASYAVVQQIATDYLDAKGNNAAEKVLFGNSRRFYRWVQRG